MHTRTLVPALLLALAAILAGCGALSPVAEKPKVTVQSVSLASASFTGIRGQVAMDVYNPNGFGIPLTRVDWSLSVGSAQAVSGSFDLSETIPAKASAPVMGSLRIDASSAIGVASQLAAGARTYTLRGTLHFQTRFGNLSVDIAGEGELAELL
jgi:LEA14-like dessication related protein